MFHHFPVNWSEADACRSPNCPSISFCGCNVYHSLGMFSYPTSGLGKFSLVGPQVCAPLLPPPCPSGSQPPSMLWSVQPSFHHTPHQRTLRNVVTPHLPITDLWYLCCTGPSAQQLHCYSSAAPCTVAACSEAAEPLFPKASAIFPLQFSCTFIFALFFLGLCACKPQLCCYGTFSQEWKIGFWSVGTRTKPPLHYLVLYISVQTGKIQPHCTAE